jgi:hypothetical protein
LKIATPLFKSRIVCFVGDDDNHSFSSTQLVLWDDFKKAKLGMIILEEMIVSFKLTKYALFIIIPRKILLFELFSLKYVCTFDDVSIDLKKNALNFTTNPIILAYPSVSNKSHIKISKSN